MLLLSQEWLISSFSFPLQCPYGQRNVTDLSKKKQFNSFFYAWWSKPFASYHEVRKRKRINHHSHLLLFCPYWFHILHIGITLTSAVLYPEYFLVVTCKKNPCAMNMSHWQGFAFFFWHHKLLAVERWLLWHPRLKGKPAKWEIILYRSSTKQKALGNTSMSAMLSYPNGAGFEIVSKVEINVPNRAIM